MAITFVGSTAGYQGTNTTDITLTQPTHQADDFGIVFGFNYNNTITNGLTATGWTQLRTDEETVEGSDRRATIWYKKYTSSSEGNPVFTVSGATQHSASLHVFRGVHITTPWDATEQYSVGSNDTTPINPAITTTTNNACLILLDGKTAGELTTVGVPTTPTGLTASSSITSTQGSWAQQATAYKLDVGTAGTITPTAWTHTVSGNTSDYSVYTLALRAATGIMLVGSSKANHGTTSDDITLTQPTHQTDDFGIIHLHSNASPDGTHGITTSGWTQLRTDLEIGGVDKRSSIFYKKYTSAAESNVTCTISDVTQYSGSLHVFRGVNTTTPFDATTTYNAGTDLSNPTNPAITTVTDNACLILCHGHQPDSGDTITTVGLPTTPSGLTLGENEITQTWATQVVAYKLDVGTAATITPTAWTHTTAGTNTADYITYTIALRPIVVGGNTLYVGSTEITNVYIGSTQINKIYVGSTLTYQAPPANVAPSVPTGLAASVVSTTSIKLDWNASTDTDGTVVGYKVYRDGGGTAIASPTGVTYTDTGLTTDQEYSYKIAAEDDDGALSAQTSAVLVTPTTPADQYRRPTSNTGTFTNPTYAYDGTGASDNSTYSDISTLNTTEVWSGFAAGTGTYATLKLHVVYELVGNASNDTINIQYSTNGGTGWTDILANAAHNAITKTDAEITLSTGQDLTDVQVRVVGSKQAGPDNQTVRMWEIYTVGTY